MVYRGYFESVPPEMVWIDLYSCNAEGVIADVAFTFIDQRDPQRNVSSEGKAFLLF